VNDYYNGELPDLTSDEAVDFFHTYSEVSPMCTNHKGMDGPGPFIETLYQAFKTRLLDELELDAETEHGDKVMGTLERSSWP